MSATIPVTIITGFLGAGKTSLVNHLIETNRETKFALIVNEFGEIGIDGDLIVDIGEDMFELSNGCLCCSLNGELVTTLMKLVHSGRTFDHLLIETTGMAEPDGIAAAFVADPAIQSRFQLNATVCVVDGVNLEASLQEREEARRQITFADYLLVNKASELSPLKRAALEEILKERNPFAHIGYADYSRAEEDLLQLQAYRLPKVTLNIQHAAGAITTPKAHTAGVVAHSFEIREPFDFLKFMHWTKVLLTVQGHHVYRMKAIIHFQHAQERFIFQSVRNQSAMQPGKPWEEGEERLSRVVVIGKGLQYDPFARALGNCTVKGC